MRLRALQAALAAAVLGLQLWPAPAPAPPPCGAASGGLLWLHPLVPPLTRVAALGDATIGAPAPGPRPGPPPGPPGGAPPPGAADRQVAHDLRLALEADAQALCAALGPERVAAALRGREALAAAMGEGAVWAGLVDQLAAAP